MNKEIAISYFKSHCLKIIHNLQVNGEQIIITKRDKPVARVTAIDMLEESLFDMFKSKAEIKNDIIQPIEEVWDASDE